MVSFLYKRIKKCGVLELFKDLDGIIILLVAENGRLKNKITFNGGFIWNDVEINVEEYNENCKLVKISNYRKNVI